MNSSAAMASEPVSLIAEAWSGHADLAQDLELALQPQGSIVDAVRSAVTWCAQGSTSLVWRWMQRSIGSAAEAKPPVVSLSLEQMDFLAAGFESIEALLQAVSGVLKGLEEKNRRLEEKVDRIPACSCHFQDRVEAAGSNAPRVPAAQELFRLNEQEGASC